VSEGLEFVVHAVLIGIGASLVLDLWTVFLKHCFGIEGLGYRMWAAGSATCREGGFFMTTSQGASAGGEAIIGWGAHFATGVIYAAVLLGLVGLDWARQPTLLPALIVGLATVVAPLFIMQPGTGAGIAASKMPQPNVAACAASCPRGFRVRPLSLRTAVSAADSPVNRVRRSRGQCPFRIKSAPLLDARSPNDRRSASLFRGPGRDILQSASVR